jgi:signal peptidase I
MAIVFGETTQPVELVPEEVITGKESLGEKIRRIITYGGVAYEISRVVVVLVLLILFINQFVTTIFVVSGPSMNTTFADGEFTFVNKWEYYLHRPQRGDVVSVKYPGNPSIRYIKRIIGLPGEQVQIRRGKIYILNSEFPKGIALYEEYLNPELKDTEPTTDADTWILGPNEFFIVGDNRPNSSDSRAWGPLPREFIIGRVASVFFPFNAFRFISSPTYNVGK